MTQAEGAMLLIMLALRRPLFGLTIDVSVMHTCALVAVSCTCTETAVARCATLSMTCALSEVLT